MICPSSVAIGKTGRSERIRTSDPLLPKQVRYQAALRSDRVARGYRFPAVFARGSVRVSLHYRSCLGGRPRMRASGFRRGVVTVSFLAPVFMAGLVRDRFDRASRSTM